MTPLQKRMRRKYTRFAGYEGSWFSTFCVSSTLSIPISNPSANKMEAERMRDRLAEAIAKIVEEEAK